jgi:transcriptional regulator with XRE-family HTH domain
MEKEKINEFSNFLRQHRESLQKKDSSYSLRKVAGRIGVQPSYLSKIERGLENPSEELVLKLAKEYSQNEDVLLAMAGKVSSRLQKIIMKNPVAFANLLSSLENSTEHSILKIVRKVRDGNW